MSSISEEKDSIQSLNSSLPSGDSIERPVSEHDNALDHEDLGKNEVPEVLPSALRPAFSNAATSVATNGTYDPDYEVDFDENDPMNPRNWSIWYKGFTIFSVSWSTWCIVVYSTSYTTGIAQMQDDFHISSEPVVTLGVTSYCEPLRVFVCSNGGI